MAPATGILFRSIALSVLVLSAHSFSASRPRIQQYASSMGRSRPPGLPYFYRGQICGPFGTTGASLNLSSSSSSSSKSRISSNEELLPGITAIDKANDELLELLEHVRDQPFFRYYSVDILASCEYMPQELFECYTETCEIYPVDEEEVPEEIRLTDLEEFDFELDGWARWDMPSNDYYDAHLFEEGYTGYDGSEIWRFIHDRICFDGYDYDDDHWKADFNKAVSGLHSMISLQVIQGIKEKADSGEEFTSDEIWRDPKAEFKRRLSPEGETPLALENLYFCYMLLLTAAAKAKDRILKDCSSGAMDDATAADLRSILASSLMDDEAVRVASRKLHDHAVQNYDAVSSLWEARMRSRELLRVMNCVQCNKCRLHGKISVFGVTTALQILLGRTGEGTDPSRLHRNEVSALITTLHKFARTVNFCQSMQP